eukprot:tig00020614_g12202.t1
MSVSPQQTDLALHEVNPLCVLRYGHDAIRIALSYIEGIARALSPSVLQRLLQSFDSLNAFIELHSVQEEKVFFPAVNKKRPGLCDFSGDHAKDLQRLSKIKDMLNDLIKEKTNEKLGEELQKALLEWCKEERQHMKKEEQAVFSVLEQIFSYDEAVLLIRDMLKLEAKAWKNTAIGYCFERLHEKGRHEFMRALQVSVTDAQYAEFYEAVHDLMCEEDLRLFLHAGLGAKEIPQEGFGSWLTNCCSSNPAPAKGATTTQIRRHMTLGGA